MLPPEQIGSVPQANAGKGALSPEQMKILRNDPEIKQAIELFVGKPVPMESVPDDLLKEVAGMVHRLGVQGAVQMAQKMLPPDIQKQLKEGVQGSPVPQSVTPSPVPGAGIAR